MLLFVATALAAPLAPTALAGPGVEISAYAGNQKAWLVEADCVGEACDALRADTLYGGELALGIAKPVSVYLHGAYVNEAVDAARYAADGYAFGGGLRGALPIGPLLGVQAWAGLEHQYTGGDDRVEHVKAWQLDAGAVLRAGRVEDGFQGWLGVGVVPWSSQAATVLDGSLTVPLAPSVPAEAVAGIQLSSEPLLGPTDRRTRLAAGVSGSVGYRTGFVGFLTFVH